MTKKNTLIILMLLIASTVNAQDINFNKSWRFFNKSAVGAEKIEFNDTQWKVLNLPHDWAIEGSFDPKYNALNGGLPFYGIGWYRKKFKMLPAQQGKIVRIEFEGAMSNASVWVNGQLVGNRPYGYIGFEFDISKYLKYDNTDNVIAVKLISEKSSSNKYSGAGIYRSVWLRVDGSTYIDTWGTYFTTPTVTEKLAVVQNETTIVNKKSEKINIEVKHEYLSPKGTSVAIERNILSIPANTKKIVSSYTNITNPERWDVENPNLYNVVTTITENGLRIDSYLTRIGLRSISYTREGFFLNGKAIRFKGVCLQHDNGALGIAVYRSADKRKLQIMKRMGVNAVKLSENPASREFLELCDELGIMVLEEAFDTWEKPKLSNGYNKNFKQWHTKDLKDMITRDRNHPSIIMWSLGNDILEQNDRKNGYKIAKKLHDICIETDPSRPTTVGVDNDVSPYVFNFAQQVNISGINYKPSKYTKINELFPELPLYGAKTSGSVSSRGIYHFPLKKYGVHKSLHITSYDMITPSWAYPPDIEFHFQEKNPKVMGGFAWTGFDYLGASAPYDKWPSHASYFGTVDMCGFPKDRFYLYQSQWTTKPMIHVLPHWNWKGMEGQEIPVYCYTNCEEAELFVNGKSMGRKIKGKDVTEIKVDFPGYKSNTFKSKYRLSWKVPYRAGDIKVVGYKDGIVVKEKQIFTAGKPYRIELSVDKKLLKSDGADLAYVTVRVLDTKGNLCPNADNLVKFSVKGEGELIGVDNGNQISVESFQAPKRKAFSGMCLAIIKSTEKKGKITLTAKSSSLESATIVFYTK